MKFKIGGKTMKKLSLILLSIIVLSIFSSNIVLAANQNIPTAKAIEIPNTSNKDNNVDSIGSKDISTQNQENSNKENTNQITKKREVSEQNLNQIRNDYKKSTENYQNLNKELNNQKQNLQTAIKEEKKCMNNCEELQQQTNNIVKNHLSTTINMIKETINRVQNKVMESEGISQENVDTITHLNQQKISDLIEFETQINQLETKDEIKSLWKNVLTYWNREKNTFKEQVNKIQSSQLNSIVVRMEVMQTKLLNLENLLVETTGEVPSDIQTSINNFFKLTDEAKLILESSESKEISKQNELHKEANDKLKQANEILIKEILPTARNYLSSDKIEEILENNIQEEINLEAEEENNIQEDSETIVENNTSETIMNAINPTLGKKAVGVVVTK
ncbi:MAG: hypothetical protein AB7V77_01920 [Candidatus Woesearchaeota archaeon]